MYAKILLLAFLLAFLLSSCASQPRVELYSLDVPVDTAPATDFLPLTLAVGRPSVQPGYDTPGMAYVTRPHQIAYFSRNRWVDTPAKMLYPILIESLSRKFRVVAKAPLSADMRLDTEVVMLRQEFSGSSSKIHLVLRAQVSRGGKTTAREFEKFEACPENDPYGGVIAANRAVTSLMREISDFCASIARH